MVHARLSIGGVTIPRQQRKKIQSCSNEEMIYRDLHEDLEAAGQRTKSMGQMDVTR